MGTAERKEREKKRRRNEILDAAEEVFFEKGLKEATMDDVAERAELSKGTIYLHFSNKEALYIGISLRAMAVLKEKFENAVKSHDNAGERLMAIGRAYTDFAYEYPYYFRTMTFVEQLQPLSHDEAEEDPYVKQCHESGIGVLQILAEVIKAGVEEGYLYPEIDPMKTAIVLWSCGNGIVQMNQSKAAHFHQIHGFEEDFLTETYMRFCARALFINPPEQS